MASELRKAQPDYDYGQLVVAVWTLRMEGVIVEIGEDTYGLYQPTGLTPEQESECRSIGYDRHAVSEWMKRRECGFEEALWQIREVRKTTTRFDGIIFKGEGL